MGLSPISTEDFHVITATLAALLVVVVVTATDLLDGLQDYGRDLIGTLCECKDNPPEVDKKCSKCQRRRFNSLDKPMPMFTLFGVFALFIGLAGELRVFPYTPGWIDWVGIGFFPLVAVSMRIWALMAVTATKRAVRYLPEDKRPELQRLLDLYHLQKKQYRAAENPESYRIENPPSILSDGHTVLLLSVSAVLCCLPSIGICLLMIMTLVIWMDILTGECRMLRKFAAWNFSHEIVEAMKFWSTPGKRRNAALRYEQLGCQLKDPSLSESEKRQIVQERLLLRAEERLRFAKEMRVLGMDSTQCTQPKGQKEEGVIPGILSDFCYHCEMANLDRVTEVALKKLSAKSELSQHLPSVDTTTPETSNNDSASIPMETTDSAAPELPLSSHICTRNLIDGACMTCIENNISKARIQVAQAQKEYEGATATRQFLLYQEAQKASKN